MIWQAFVDIQCLSSLRMIRIYSKMKKKNECMLNIELNENAKWLKVNKLTLNVDKTQCMLFTRKRCKTKLNTKIKNSSITQVTKTKFLGIIIDEKLNWKDHIFTCIE